MRLRMITALTGFLAMLCMSGGAARAMPGAMPWDHAGEPGLPDCTDCHFDTEAVKQSPALCLTGLPQMAVPGESYNLVLRLAAEPLERGGFLMRAQARTSTGRRIPPGSFRPVDRKTEAGDGAIRSTAEGAQPARPGLAEWRFSWRAPENVTGILTFYIASVAANDDDSPLGDQVHLQQVKQAVRRSRD